MGGKMGYVMNLHLL